MGKYNCRARNKFEQQVEELKNTLFDLEERLKELPLSQMQFLNAKESAELGRAFVEGLEEGLKKGYQDYYSLNQGGKIK